MGKNKNQTILQAIKWLPQSFIPVYYYAFHLFLAKMWIIKIKTELHTDIQQLFKT